MSGHHSPLLVAGAFLAVAITAGGGGAEEVVSPEAPARWFKGNLHAHSLWSDGNDFPEMIAEWYRARGYHFLAFSDHNVLSEGERWIDESRLAEEGAVGAVDRYRARFGDDWVERRRAGGRPQIRLKPLHEFRPLVEQRGEFLLIQAEEISDSAEGVLIHVNASNLRDLIEPQGGASVRETIANNLAAIERQRRRLARPILAHLSHPNFYYAVTAEDLAAVVEERFFEVFNGHPQANHRGDARHASSERLWDIANTIRLAQMNAPPLFGLATDDSHDYYGQPGPSPGRGWIMVRARHLTPGSIIQAIEKGDFYASTGVVLSRVHFDPGTRTLALEIDPRQDETYVTQFIGTPRDYDPASAPIVDERGNEIRATRRYSKQVGMLLATRTGPSPSYRLSGDELYVRATVTASTPPENPVFDGQRRQAWTQPAGWERSLAPDPPTGPADD